ncbi:MULTISPECIES: nucleotide disphospho-sugar-binding domain-containing protein [unclassified Actinopolyspora]|uniref:nucleotide disphospho-sugar-binding domain-containing protein n=1 Tax=unclassified Actinopolyspora TaxID=2639451 RepID=UPI0013F654B6|nr:MULTISPECIES: nucleotide disphospho-sugar-binding domain-containing protein [unclassified Actinopolyspora]NHD19336.1 DUF1205 domain-containing protein [Actinopolyspora sp. BKK2]NHE78460.1 DUF1205 domain-containing protein [Actinopolyspora sp. BKK1]
MRVLFAISPGLDHLYPALGLAWSLRIAGHDVVVATSGPATDAATRAGLAAVDVAPGVDFASLFPKPESTEDRARMMRERGRKMTETLATPEIILDRFAAVNDRMLDGTLSLARTWGADLVVYSRVQGSALVVARAMGIPAVENGYSFLREGELPGRFLPYLKPLYERHEIPVELPETVQLHFAPEFMMRGEGEGWSVRFTPYQGGSVLPDWLLRPRERRRVVVTLGTVVPGVSGAGSLHGLIEAAAESDAEFVLALGDDIDLSPLGTLPDNVRPVGWTPLSTLLPTLDGIIHHGGCATTLSSAQAGVPQLAIPHGADNWINANMIEDCGIGFQRELEDFTKEDLDLILDDTNLRSRCAEVAGNIALQPGPDLMVPQLAALATNRSAIPAG